MATAIQWTQRKIKNGRWCQIEVDLKDGRLSICGSEGRVFKDREAKALARRYWEDFFAENEAELAQFALKYGKRTPKTAARYVIEQDGEYHGLDLEGGRPIDGQAYVIESCGQIRDDLAEWFPEHVPYFKWHLNDMHAGCEHQEALGWGRGFDVALSKNALTPIQRQVLTTRAEALVSRQREAEVKKREERINKDGRYRISILAAVLGHHPSVDDAQTFTGGQTYAGFPSFHANALRIKVHDYLVAQVTNEIPTPPLESGVYKDSIGAPCPECGYRYGTAWLKRELPADVVAWAVNRGQPQGVTA